MKVWCSVSDGFHSQYRIKATIYQSFLHQHQHVRFIAFIKYHCLHFQIKYLFEMFLMITSIHMSRNCWLHTQTSLHFCGELIAERRSCYVVMLLACQSYWWSFVLIDVLRIKINNQDEADHYCVLNCGTRPNWLVTSETPHREMSVVFLL